METIEIEREERMKLAAEQRARFAEMRRRAAELRLVTARIGSGELSADDPDVQSAVASGLAGAAGVNAATVFTNGGIEAFTGGACRNTAELAKSVVAMLGDASKRDSLHTKGIETALAEGDSGTLAELCNKAAFGGNESKYKSTWSAEEALALTKRNRDFERTLSFMAAAGVDKGVIDVGVRCAFMVQNGCGLEELVNAGVFEGMERDEDIAAAMYVADVMRTGYEPGFGYLARQFGSGFGEGVADTGKGLKRGATDWGFWQIYGRDDESKSFLVEELVKKHGGLEELFASTKGYVKSIELLDPPMSDLFRYGKKAAWMKAMNAELSKAKAFHRRANIERLYEGFLEKDKIYDYGAVYAYAAEAAYSLGQGTGQLLTQTAATAAGVLLGGGVGGVIATAIVSGAPEYEQSMKDYRRRGMSEEDAQKLALGSSAVVGGIEAFTFKMIGADKLATGLLGSGARKTAAQKLSDKIAKGAAAGVAKGAAEKEAYAAAAASARAGFLTKLAKEAVSFGKNYLAEGVVEEGVQSIAKSALELSSDYWREDGLDLFTWDEEKEELFDTVIQGLKYGMWQTIPMHAAARAGERGNAPTAERFLGTGFDSASGRMRTSSAPVTLARATAAEINAQAYREARAEADRGGVPKEVADKWTKDMTAEEREGLVAKHKLTEEQIARLDAAALYAERAKASGDESIEAEKEAEALNKALDDMSREDFEGVKGLLEAEDAGEAKGAEGEAKGAEGEAKEEGEDFLWDAKVKAAKDLVWKLVEMKSELVKASGSLSYGELRKKIAGHMTKLKNVLAAIDESGSESLKRWVAEMDADKWGEIGGAGVSSISMGGRVVDNAQHASVFARMIYHAVKQLERARREKANGVDYGKYRANTDYSAEKVRKTFGFRSLTFEAGRGKFVYEQLLNLAEMMRVPPEALGMGGRIDIHIKTATRRNGVGGSYSPTYKYIKLNQLGTAAHEWFHALDDLLAKDTSERGGAGMTTSAAREVPLLTGARSSVQRAFRNLYGKMKGSRFAKASRSGRHRDYFSSPHETAARAFEIWALMRGKGSREAADLLRQEEEYYRKFSVTGRESSRRKNAEAAARGEQVPFGQYPSVEEMEADGIASAFDALRDALLWTYDAHGSAMLYKTGDGRKWKVTSARAKKMAGLIRSIEAKSGVKVIWESAEEIMRSASRAEGARFNAEFLGEGDFGEDGRVKPEVFAEIEAEKAKIREDAQKNGSFMKAPNGKPSQLNGEQWVLVRTKRFKRWFGDWENNPENSSKVVDENGEPKVVYHGTGAKFYEFSHKFGMRNGASLGRGFYFTEDEDYARGYGNEVMGVFLNIRNPLEPGRNKISKEDLKRVIRRIDPNGDTVADYASSTKGYPGREWYERSLDEAVNAIFSVSNNYVETSDSDILGELFSVWGGESALRGVAEVLGYDGFIPKRTLSDDVKIAFFPEQIKSSTENAGTYAGGNADIRYSRRRASRSSPVDEARMALATRDKIKDFEVVFDRDGTARFFDTRGKKPHEYELVFSLAGEIPKGIVKRVVTLFEDGALRTSSELHQFVSSLRNEQGGVVASRGGTWRRAFVDNLGRSHELSRENGEISDGISDDEGNRGDGEGLGRGGVRYLNDSSGAVCGYYDPVRNELHLNKDFSDFDTPIHEWTHVWMGWVKRMDARVWRKALEVTKGTKAFAKFKADAEADAGSVYHGLDDDGLAEEVFARLCGEKGEAIMESEGLDTWAKVRRAVLDAFKTVLRTLGLSDEAVESLRFEDVRSMCLRDLMDDETFGVKGIRATATKGSRVRDAVDDAAADAGIKDAAWKRKVRSASVYGAAKLLKRYPHLSAAEAGVAEAELRSFIESELREEDSATIDAAVKVAMLYAKMVYSTRDAVKDGVMTTNEAVDAVARAQRALRTEKILRAAYECGNIDAELYAEAKEYMERYRKMTETGRGSKAKKIAFKELELALGGKGSLGRMLLNREERTDVTGKIIEAVEKALGEGAKSWDVLNAARETLADAYGRAARTWARSASRDVAERAARRILAADTRDQVEKAARSCEKLLKEHGVRLSIAEAVSELAKRVGAVTSRVGERTDKAETRRNTGTFIEFAKTLEKFLVPAAKAVAAVEKANSQKGEKRKASAASRLAELQKTLEGEMFRTLDELRGEADGSAAKTALLGRLGAMSALAGTDFGSAGSVRELLERFSEADEADSVKAAIGNDAFKAAASRASSAITAAVNARADKKQYDKEAGFFRKTMNWTWRYVFGLDQWWRDVTRYAKGSVRAAAEKEINKLHEEETGANLKKEIALYRRTARMRDFLRGRIGLKTDGDVRGFMRKIREPREDLKRFSLSGEAPMTLDQVANLYLGLRQEDTARVVDNMSEDELSADEDARLLARQASMLDDMRRTLSENGVLDYAEGLSELLTEETDRMNEACSEYFGLSLVMFPKNELYFPVKRRRKEGLDLDSGAGARTNIVPSAALPRLPNSRPLDDEVGATDAFLKNMNEVEHFIAYGTLSRKYSLILSDKGLTTAIHDKHGSDSLTALRNIAADTVNGQYSVPDEVGTGKLTNVLADVVSVLALGLNVGSALKQLSSFLVFANEVGWSETFKAIMGAADGGLRERLGEMTSHPLWHARYQGSASAKNLERLLSGGKSRAGDWWRAWSDFSMITLRAGDAGAVLIVGQGLYGATKARLMRKLNPETGKLFTEEEARDAAMATVMDLADRTQQAGRTANFNVWQRRGNALGRIVGQFQSSTGQMYGAEIHAARQLMARGIRDKGARDAFVSTVLNNHLIIPALTWSAGIFIKALFRGELPDEDDFEDIWQGMLLGQFGGLFLFGGLLAFLVEDGYRQVTFPAFSMLTDVGYAAGGVLSAMFDGDGEKTVEKAKKLLKKASAVSREAVQLWERATEED